MTRAALLLGMALAALPGAVRAQGNAPPASTGSANTGPAGLTHPSFDCIGAEQLEDDAFAIPFARGAGTLAAAADGALEALFARASAEPTRSLCIFGHAGPQEGGATANTRLAARRAAAVAEDLAKRGLPRERLRAEIRVAAFARSAAIPAGRSVTVVLLPAP
jgi:outer membrane protein OmpA-like peptidoglycan-associated protein